MGRRKGASPAELSLALLRKEGYRCGMVEKFIHATKQRMDLFGIIDLLAIYPDLILGVQCCTLDDYHAHAHLYRDDPHKAEALHDWLDSGGKFEIHAWGKGVDAWANKPTRRLWLVKAYLGNKGRVTWNKSELAWSTMNPGKAKDPKPIKQKRK